LFDPASSADRDSEFDELALELVAACLISPALDNFLATASSPSSPSVAKEISEGAKIKNRNDETKIKMMQMMKIFVRGRMRNFVT
jgi:hypothetical protein